MYITYGDYLCKLSVSESSDVECATIPSYVVHGFQCCVLIRSRCCSVLFRYSFSYQNFSPSWLLVFLV